MYFLAYQCLINKDAFGNFVMLIKEYFVMKKLNCVINFQYLNYNKIIAYIFMVMAFRYYNNFGKMISNYLIYLFDYIVLLKVIK